jgi:hypothetical protein
MNYFYLNIGLWHAGTQDEMMVSHALAQVEAHELTIRRVALVRMPGEEPSLVVHGGSHLDRADVEAILFKVAQELGQQCIALWWCGGPGPRDRDGVYLSGSLVGPGAAQWGAFDLTRFHFL